MPTYDDLRTYFDNSEPLTALVRSTSKIDIVRGYTLDVDPLWILAYDVEEGVFREEHFDSFLRAIQRYPWPMRAPYGGAPRAEPAFQGYRRRDLTRKVRLWDLFTDDLKTPRHFGPVIMTIVYGPLRTPVTGPTDLDDQESLGRLVRLVRESGASARIEERPRAQLAVAGGDDITAAGSKSGTYGGTLYNAHGGAFGMTCAHVASKGDVIYDVGGTNIGACLADSSLTPLPSGTVCDPVVLAAPAPYPGNGPAVNMLDLALIDLSVTPIAASLGGIAASLTIGQDVTIEGAAGRTNCKLGSLALSYAFSRGGQDYCFRDSIELRPQPRLPIGGALGQLSAGMPTQGDSGAWVLTRDASPVWAGVFFGEDGTRGFAVRASWAHAWAEQVAGGTLTV